jgi:hypothetical protein
VARGCHSSYASHQHDADGTFSCYPRSLVIPYFNLKNISLASFKNGRHFE